MDLRPFSNAFNSRPWLASAWSLVKVTSLFSLMKTWMLCPLTPRLVYRQRNVETSCPLQLAQAPCFATPLSICSLKFLHCARADLRSIKTKYCSLKKMRYLKKESHFYAWTLSPISHFLAAILISLDVRFTFLSGLEASLSYARVPI